eukprot:scaffold37745_cov67-Cyclotella_meneghiniana.AAC.4
MAKSSVTLSESEQMEEMEAVQAIVFNFDELVEVGGEYGEYGSSQIFTHSRPENRSWYAF